MAIVAMLALSFAGCKKDSANPLNANDGCKIAYTINGQKETSTPDVCLYLDGTLNMGLIGSNGIQIQINDLTGPATFKAPGDDIVILLDLKDGTRLSMKSGTITVTEFNNSRVKGTFSGDFVDIADLSGPSMPLTAGEFSAEI